MPIRRLTPTLKLLLLGRVRGRLSGSNILLHWRLRSSHILLRGRWRSGIGHAFNAFSETLQAFTQSLAQFRKPFGAKQ